MNTRHQMRHMSEREALTELGRFAARRDAEHAQSEAERLKIAEDHAAKWTAEKRAQAVKNGDAMPGGKYPIIDQEDMNAAAKLIGNGDAAADAVEEHMKKQAKKHGLTLPKSMQGS